MGPQNDDDQTTGTTMPGTDDTAMGGMSNDDSTTAPTGMPNEAPESTVSDQPAAPVAQGDIDTSVESPVQAPAADSATEPVSAPSPMGQPVTEGKTDEEDSNGNPSGTL